MTASEPSQTGNGDRLRVLVVEATTTRRTIIIENLKQYDFDVYYAEGNRDVLLTHAQHLIMEMHCHVVVLNGDLLDSVDHTDPASSDVCRQLAPAGVVIYSTDAADDVAYIAGWHQMGYIRQSDSPQTLAHTVRAHARKRQLHIEWPHEAFYLEIASTLGISVENDIEQDIADLLSRVFPKAVAVDLRILPAMNHADDAVKPVRRSVVLWTQEHRPFTNYLTPKVIKIGVRQDIETEVANYQEYVEGRLGQNRQARLEGHDTLWHVGAIAYAFLGASPEAMVTFREYYAASGARQVLGVLDTLFLSTCRAWYQNERQYDEDAAIFPLYNAAIDMDEHLSRLDRETYHLRFDGVERALPNPALWMIREGQNMTFPRVTRCIAHGDMHGDNFFVDSMGTAWLIDFGRTGWTHALRDFVELEADLKLRLTRHGQESVAVAALESALLASRSLSDVLLPTAAVVAHPPTYKAFQVIAGLRHLAFLATGITDIREYNLALLCETLFLATLNRLRAEVKQDALFSAALIADRLSRRTGLLARQRPAVPHLDEAALVGLPASEVSARLQAHMALLKACYESAELQAQRYHDGVAPAPEFTASMEAIRQEGMRIRGISG